MLLGLLAPAHFRAVATRAHYNYALSPSCTRQLFGATNTKPVDDWKKNFIQDAFSWKWTLSLAAQSGIP